MLLVSTGKTIILIGIYMQGVCHSALGYGSPLSFGAGSVLPISRLTSTYCQRVLTYKCLAVPGHTAHVKPPPPSVLTVTFRTLWFCLHLHFQWNWMRELNRLNFLQWRNPPIVFGRERKERNLNCVSLQRVVAVSSTSGPLPTFLEVN